jgi:hypothetical protein
MNPFPPDPEHIRRREEAFKEALNVLKSQPGYALAQTQYYERRKKAETQFQPNDSGQGEPFYNSRPRLNNTLLLLDIKAETHLELVVDMQTQDAFALMLQSEVDP